MIEPIRVVVVDDSPIVCRLLTGFLLSVPGIQVVGTAGNGPRGLELVRQLRPHVLTLDLEMPGMHGLAVLEQVMQSCPTPVILISGISRQAATTTLRALEMGAVDFILKYTPGVDTDPESLRQEISAKVRLAANIKVIRSLTGRAGTNGGRARLPAGTDRLVLPTGKLLPYLSSGVVVIGASTGGPLALRELLSNLPADFPSAVIVVQHIPATFTPVLAAQLDRQAPLHIRQAKEGDRLEPGRVLVAPGDFHLLVRPDARVQLVQGPKIGGHCPSIDVTMQAAAQVYGPRSQGVVLTGMGSDGTLGLRAIRTRGGRTFAQDAASCVINGMPQKAIDQGVVDHIAPPAEIARLLCLFQHRSGRKGEP